MKTFKAIFSLFLCLVAFTGFSQKSEQTKPKLFAAYPASIQLSKNILQHTINSTEGEVVVVAFSDDFQFKGTVISNQKKYSNLQCVMIKSPAFENAIFQLAKITNDDKSFSYTGRIINSKAADGYEIKKDKDDNYRFIKFETKNILQDCSF